VAGRIHPYIVDRRGPRRDLAKDRRQRGDSELNGREWPRRPVRRHLAKLARPAAAVGRAGGKW